MSLQNGRCDRCNKPVRALRMSIFCTEMCCEACLSKERKHPLYRQARAAEYEQIKQGNYNFVGIGKPSDL